MAPRGYRNNNPGNLEATSYTQGLPGYVGTDGRHAIFDSMESGLGAMGALLDTPNYRNRSVSDVISRWAPASDNNDPAAYAKFVAEKAGVDVNDPSVMNDPATKQKVIQAMAHFENGAPLPTTDSGATTVAPGQGALSSTPSMGPGPLSGQQVTPAQRRPIPGALSPQGDDLKTSLEKAAIWGMSINDPKALSNLQHIAPKAGRYTQTVDNERGVVRVLDTQTGQSQEFPIPGWTGPKVEPGIVDKVTQAHQQSVMLHDTSDQAQKLKEMIKNGTLDLGLASRGRQYIENMFGASSPQTQAYNQFDVFRNQAANAILQAAKGTQTEGDATRAYNQFTTALAANDPASVRQALDKLIEVNGKLIGANQTSLDAYSRMHPKSPVFAPFQETYSKMAPFYKNRQPEEPGGGQENPQRPPLSSFRR